MHEHKDCKHKLEYCHVCDVAYCTKCEKEWFAKPKYKVWYGTGTSPFIYTINDGMGEQPEISDGTAEWYTKLHVHEEE